MASKKILVVFGAIGNQGGSVIKAIIGDPAVNAQFEIRGVTRDPSKPAAAALAKQGVIVIQADLDDKLSLTAALKDAYAVFAVTNFHELMSKEREIQQGKNIAEVSKEQNVQHLIWSSLPYVSKITKGKITGVLHFDGKAIVEEYIRSLGIPATFIQIGVFMNYLLFYLKPSSPGAKTYKFSLPCPSDLKIPLISVKEDTGKYVKAILLNREKVLGRQIFAGEAEYSIEEFVEIMRDVGGLDVVIEQVDDGGYRAALAAMGLPDFFVEDMSDNMKYISTYGFFGSKENVLKEGHKLVGEKLESFQEWVAKSPEIAALK